MQTQFTKYKAEISSFELRQAMMGVIKPGRYKGFNRLIDVSPLTVRVDHFNLSAQENIAPLMNRANQQVPFWGAFVMNNGTIYRQTTPIEVSLTNNATGQPRYDLIVANAPYAEDEDGVTATYRIITGVQYLSSDEFSNHIVDFLGSYFIADNQYDRNEVVLGMFKVEANATTSLNGISYRPHMGSIFNTFQSTREILNQTIIPLLLKPLNPLTNNDIINLSDIEMVPDNNAFTGYFIEANDSWNNKTIRVKGFTGAGTSIIVIVPRFISKGVKFDVLWDERPIKVQASQLANSAILVRAGKEARNEAQYTRFTVHITESYRLNPLRDLEMTITGDLANI